MRAIWSGTVSFGLVSVPVKLYSATESHDVDLHQVHDADGGRIRYQRRCEVCGKTVDYAHIDKAYDDGEDTVVLSDEELESLPAEADKEIEVVQFVPDEQIDPMTFEKSYYLEPAAKSAKAYILLRRTLEETARTAVVTFALRSRTRLAALRVRDDVIVLQTMLWADEVRDADFDAASAEVRISKREMEMSRALVEQFSEDYEPERFVDEYQEELRTLIDEKLDQGDALDTDATFGRTDDEDGGDGEGGGDVIDLMEALKRSVEKRRGTQAGGSQTGGSQAGTAGSGASAKGSKSGTAKKGSKSKKKSSDSAKTSAKKSPQKGSKSGRKPASKKKSTSKKKSSGAKSSKSASGTKTSSSAKTSKASTASKKSSSSKKSGGRKKSA
ncbi:Ku protein [Nocardia zapadnayensis]|nr:Ku protein [Nocardia zapadnayensis]MCX0276973.1 Ku protein [Nocardia zapadnayensis]